MNNNHRIVDSGVIHCTISDQKAGVPKAAPRIIEHRLYKNYDKDVFIHHFNKIYWDLVNNTLNVEMAFKLWNDLFTSVADQHAPIKQTRWKGFQAPWIISDLNQTMRAQCT